MVEREAAESPAPTICNELHAFAGTARGVMTGPGEKRVERRNWRQIDPCAREKPMADWKKVLANLGSGKRITKKAYAGRGQETIWEMSDKGSI